MTTSQLMIAQIGNVRIVTLGIVSQRPAHPVEGYLAFGTLVLYLVGLAGLPRAAWHMARAQLASGHELRTKD